jgi:eukaryotic-like serine/threonine-protein kinase
MQNLYNTLPVGTIIRERYIVKSLIGTGNAGAVYLVEDQRVKRTKQRIFALKEIVGLSQQERYQFIFDYVPLRQLHHQALPRLYHIFNEDNPGRVYVVMDYVEGSDLETVCQQQAEQRFAWIEVIRTLEPIVDAICYLHLQRPPIVHGNIKPVNIILGQNEDRCTLVDIGVFRDGTALVESSNYQAPEQYNKSMDTRADIYGLGATCYTLLTGVIPPNALTRAAQWEREQTDPLQSAHTIVPTIPLSVSQAIERSLSLFPQKRFTSVEDFWNALQATAKVSKLVVSDTVLSEGAAKFENERSVESKQGQQSAPRATVAAKRKGEYTPHFPSLKKYAMLILLLVLLLGVGSSLGIWQFVQHHPVSPASANLPTTITARPPRSRSKGTSTLVIPTSSPGNYPNIAGSYAGTIVDVSSKASMPMILQGIYQIGSNITGSFTAGSPLSISDSFQGTIDLSKNFRFTVSNAEGRPLLFFEGGMQTATSLSGDYYSCASTPAPMQGKSCTQASQGYGIWNVLKVPAL